MLTLHIGNVFTDIYGAIPAEVYQKLRKTLSFRPNGFEFSTMYNRWIKDKDGKQVRRMWDGYRRQIWKSKDRKRVYFPTGLLSQVRTCLTDIECKFVENRVKPKPELSLEFDENLTMRDYQEPIVDKSCLVGRGIIQVATGGGKTIIAEGIIKKLNVKPFIFFVTSIDLLTQAKNSFEADLRQNGSPIKVGQIGGGVIDIRDINVMTVQTAVRALGQKWDAKHRFDTDDADDKTPIAKRREDIIQLIKTAKGVICDEVQHWRAETCQLVTRTLNDAYYIFGCSATPYRDEGDDIMINACFGKKLAEISASQLIKDGWLIKPSIKIVHIRGDVSPFRQWQSLYKDQVTENQNYNQIIASIANSFIENERLVLVLVQQIKHGKTLESMIPGSVFLSGSSSKKKREEKVEELRNKKISCIISSTIFDEGIDIRPLDTLLLAGQGKSRVRAMQRIGRILRPFKGKTVATAIDFRIHQRYLLNHSKEREKMYRTEPEFNIEEIDP